METDTEKDEKKCWKCKRTIVGGSKLGLCPKCFNTIGSWAAVGLVGILTTLGFTKGGKFAEDAVDWLKNNKS